MVLAELTGVVAEVEQDLGDVRRPRKERRRTARELRRDQTYAEGIHARREGCTPGGAALHGVVVGELQALAGEAIDVRRFAVAKSHRVRLHLHPADVVSHVAGAHVVILFRGRRGN